MCVDRAASNCVSACQSSATARNCASTNQQHRNTSSCSVTFCCAVFGRSAQPQPLRIGHKSVHSLRFSQPPRPELNALISLQYEETERVRSLHTGRLPRFDSLGSEQLTARSFLPHSPSTRALECTAARLVALDTTTSTRDWRTQLSAISFVCARDSAASFLPPQCATVAASDSRAPHVIASFDCARDSAAALALTRVTPISATDLAPARLVVRSRPAVQIALTSATRSTRCASS